MFLNHSHIISHPYGDFEYVHTSGSKQAGEGVTHHMRRHPGNALRFHVVGKRSAEIVAIAVFAVLGFGMQHEGRAQTVIIANEGQELSSQRDTAFLAILKVHRRGFRQMEKPGFQVEPFRNRFDNLRAAKPGVEAAEQDKAEISARTVGNEFVTECRFTERLPWPLIDTRQLDTDNGAAPDDSLVNAPFEKAAHDHQITEGAAGRETSTTITVETLNVARSDVGGRNGWIEAREEYRERVGLIARGGPAVNVHLALVSDEPLDQSLDSVANRQLRDFPNFVCAPDCLGVVASFEADVFPNLFVLNGQPIDGTPEINAAPLFSHNGDCHISLSHFAILKRGKTWHSESSVERVTRLELATSSLAILRSVEGIVTLAASHSPKKEGL